MATQAVEGRTRRTSALMVLVVLVFAAVAVGFVMSGSKAQAQEPATPVCPQGSTFNAATGQCETPALSTPCPAGTTLVGTTCTATLECPGQGDFGGLLPVLGDTSAMCVGAQPTLLICPEGTRSSSFSAGTPGSITCTAPQGSICPAGFTPSGTLCVTPPTFTCPPGFTLSGTTCLPPATTTTTTLIGGTAGDADARGGDGGSVRGGDGGRGGSGTLPICNQNTNNSSWEGLVQEVDEDGYVVDEYVVIHEAEPSVECEAGGRGGSGGDAGIAEAGDGGLAFSVG